MGADQSEAASRATTARLIPAVRVYSTGPQCPQCRLTIQVLQSTGVPHEVIRIDEPDNNKWLEYVTDELGYTQAPVVEVDDEPENHWCGFRPDLITRLIEQAAKR